MTRPAHSAARDAAWGQFYAKRGLRNAIVQGAQGGTQMDNQVRIAEYRNKVAVIPRELRDKQVPIGAGVVLNFRRKI